MKKIFKYSLFLLLIGFASSCVDSYNVDIYTVKGYLLVDGTITNLNEPQYVILARTKADTKFKSSDFTSDIVPSEDDLIPQTKAGVELVVNGGAEVYRLSEVEPGIYQTPARFVGKIGNTYQLRILTSDNRRYISLPEKILPVPAIKSVAEQYNERGVLEIGSSSERIPSHDLYIDFDDTPNQRNFYRWRWVGYELLKYCETCVQARYYKYESAIGQTGDCFKDYTLATNEYADYVCDDRCWGLFPNTDINIFTDVYTDGQAQKGKLVAQVPYYQSNPCMVSIQQLSISANAYRYYKLLKDQSQSVGTLADTPPAPIQSNIVNQEDDREIVLGYFSASAVSEVRQMIDRKDVKNYGADYNRLFQIFNNREPQGEGFNIDRQKPETAICKLTRNKTPIVPNGWKY
jgi:hypothetical protein